MATSKSKPQWYIVSTQIMLENKIKEEIEKRVSALGLKKRIPEVIVPTQKKIVVKDGKQKIKEDRLFPGYVLIKMAMDNDTFALIRNIEGVKGFISTGKKPKPLTKEEVDNIMKFKDKKQPTYQKTFQSGDAVKISKGAFADFIGTVQSSNTEKGKVKVLISIFGRETPVELDFEDVSKLE
ncbi:transcription termination/antitermination factor NusG [Candidatus Dojkabacteria bacterium]|nr:transcription termination/antitermination factor NusG [Candidatus Dojkabacteria bacterium]